MSYLNFPRLTFSGQFQADVSTVNNDTRHFDNDTFNSDFQKFSEKNQLNGWWNPVGTGIFRLNDCKITALLGPDGLATAAKIAISHDPAIIYKPGDGVVSSGLAYVAVRVCQAVVC